MGLKTAHSCRPVDDHRTPSVHWLLVVAMAPTLLLTFGCAGDLSRYHTPAREQHGYVIVLPGIEGKSVFNANIAKGLANGGVPGAIEVYDWTVGGPFTWAWNLRYESRNRREASKVAAKIMAYQNSHPGKPVHIIGHSGGGGLAVYALEALPPTRKIDSAILLAGALSPSYDLSTALRRTNHGIWNFYSQYDVGWLRAGTTVFGTVDGKHSSSSGAVGFVMPWGLSKEDRELYRSKLFQKRYSPEMARSGHIGGHFGWADDDFVATWLAPLILSQHHDEPQYAADPDSSRLREAAAAPPTSIPPADGSDSRHRSSR